MSDILIQQNNEALVPPEFPTNVREQAPVLIQENILQDGGIAATVDVASTTTLEPDTPAYVNNIGDEKHAVLQFGIPKGETGAAGVDGVDGQAATITVGSTTTVNPDESAAVVNSGTSQNAVLNFSIPQGVQGEQGEQGFSPRAYVEQTATGAMIHIDDFMTETNVEVFNGQDGADGQAATVSVGTTTTGAAGTNASVVNSGSTSAAVLDFTIPRGADGAAGRDGTDGSDGFSPIATVSQNTGSATITITDANGTTTATVYDGSDAPVPNDGTLTIQKNGTTVQTFTANQSSNATANITVPTQFSDLTGTISTSEITNNAITPAKLSDTGWILADQYVNTTYFSPRTHIYYRILAGVVYWSGAIYCHTTPNSQSADLMTGLPNDLMPRDEATFYGDQFYVSNSSYQIWTENNGFKVLEYNQNIPATYDYQGYTLTQIQYISGNV